MKIKDLKGIIGDDVRVIIFVENESNVLLDHTIFDDDFINLTNDEILEFELGEKPINSFDDCGIYFSIEVPDEKYRYFEDKYKEIDD